MGIAKLKVQIAKWKFDVLVKVVTPMETGVHGRSKYLKNWIPAFAGMTGPRNHFAIFNINFAISINRFVNHQSLDSLILFQYYATILGWWEIFMIPEYGSFFEYIRAPRRPFYGYGREGDRAGC
jgi:hypothetical protein